MAKSIPTEESLGIAVTEAELEAPATVEDDDVSLTDDPAPEAEAAPAAKAEGDGDQPAEKAADEPKQVDLRALQEARAEAREAKQRNSMLEQRMNDILASMARPQQAEPAQEPAMDEGPPQDDPLALLQWLAKEVQQQKLTAAEAQQIANEQGQRHYHQTQVAQLEQQFRATAPDYDDALNFAAAARERELEILHPYSTADQRRQYVLQEWGQVTMQALQTGANPAELAYKYAQARGYAPQAQQQPAPKALDTAAISSAQQRHQSLSDAPGGDAPPALDAKALAKMSDKDFKSWLSKRGNEAKLDEILGA